MRPALMCPACGQADRREGSLRRLMGRFPVSTCAGAHRRASAEPPWPPSCHAPLPMSRPPSRRSGPSVRTSGAVVPRLSVNTPCASTVSTWPRPGCRQRPWTRPWPGSTRTSGPRWRRPSAAPGRCIARRSRPRSPPGSPRGRPAAGVGSIAVASPPQARYGGLPHPSVLAACALLGVTEVHAAGGAQALAMFAYGTADCSPADVITGPGNVYVAAAKRVLRGVVGTDGEAGPTEVAIIADDTADPVHVAADLVAQAEHDGLAACLLITCDADLAGRVDDELGRQVPATRHRERVETALAGQSACVIVDDLDAALAVSDAWAPEHLEIQARDAGKLAARVTNAGAVFAGPYSPVSLGDYLAGSNHVLPTGGTARHTSGLSVFPFLRLVNVVECDRAALAATAPLIDALGGAEDLAAHVAAVRVRVPREGGAG